jgi:cation diffusion facilitator family transporter
MADANLRLPIQLSILAAVATILLKGTAWLQTGSVSLLSDAAESLVNLAAACVAYLALLYASRPVDREHTYGHEKIEFFSSGLEGGLIFIAAVTIAWTAIERLVRGGDIHKLDLGLALSGVAAVVNLAVAQLLLRVGRKHHSIVLEADGQHLMTDVWTSAAVLAGLGMVWLTGAQWLDPVMALLMAAYIMATGWRLVQRSFDGLMDRALPDDEVALLRQTIGSLLKPGMTFHALRTRRAGSRRFADFHLLVPGQMSVAAAHDLVDEIEEAMRAALGNLEVQIHLEPIEASSAWHDSELLNLEKSAGSEAQTRANQDGG